MERSYQLQQAWELYYAGQLDQAEAVCSAFHPLTGQAAEPLLLRGLIAQSRGSVNEAATMLARAAEYARLDPEIQLAVGLAHVQQGRFWESVECFRRATVSAPEDPAAWLYLAKSLKAAGDYAEALLAFRKVSEMQPDSAEAWSDRGAVALLAANVEEAAHCLEIAVRLRPDDSVAHLNLGTARKHQKRPAEALACYRTANLLRPDWEEALLSLSAALCESGDRDGALAACSKALALQPKSAAAQLHLGVVLMETGNLVAATEAYMQAANYDPNWYLPWFNLGNLRMLEGNCKIAAEHYRAAIARNPNSALLHSHLAVALLTLGEWSEGWKEYEWRWGQPVTPPRAGFPQPVWAGEPLDGRIITLWMEQGFGDTIQFIRYAALLKSQGATVWFCCHRPLQRLMESCTYIDRVFGPGDPIDNFHYQLPLLSLPRLFNTMPDTIPSHVPFLKAPPEEIPEIADLPQQVWRVGIAWSAGNQRHELAARDCPVHLFENLARIDGIELFSLQFAKSEDECPNWLHPLAAAQGDFASSAAAVEQMDLIISVDTALAHLAGALGKPVWVLLKKYADWRWLRDRDDSLWYSSMRLFRQHVPGGWEAVMERLETELKKMLSHGGKTRLRFTEAKQMECSGTQ